METRIMILPFGEILVGKPQTIGHNERLKWHLFWMHTDGDKMVSIHGFASKFRLIKEAEKHHWTINE